MSYLDSQELFSSSLFPFKNVTPSCSQLFHQPHARVCVCIPSPISPPLPQYSTVRAYILFPCLCCTWHGRDCTAAHALHHHDTLIGLLLEGGFKFSEPCALRGAWALSNRRKQSGRGGLSENSPSFSFSLPQPAHNFVGMPFFKHRGSSMKEKSKTAFSYLLNTGNITLTFLLFLSQFISYALLGLYRLLTVPVVYRIVRYLQLQFHNHVSYEQKYSDLKRPVCQVHKEQCNFLFKSAERKTQTVHNVSVCFQGWVGLFWKIAS